MRLLVATVLLASALATPLLGMSLTAQAKATKTPVSFQVTFELVDPGRSWVDDDGVFHIRRLTTQDTIDGDFVGTGSQVVNANIDAMGNGDNVLSFIIEGTWGGLVGTFEGKASGTFVEGIGSGGLVGHGSGGFAGLKLEASWASVLGSGMASIEGVIHESH